MCGPPMGWQAVYRDALCLVGMGFSAPQGGPLPIPLHHASHVIARG
jgi:hypothetical protein